MLERALQGVHQRQVQRAPQDKWEAQPATDPRTHPNYLGHPAEVLGQAVPLFPKVSRRPGDQLGLARRPALALRGALSQE